MAARFCEKCGAEKSGAICWNCGAGAPQQPQQGFHQPTNNQAYQSTPVVYDEGGFLSDRELSEKNGVSGTVKIIDWLKVDLLSLLNFIPIIGSIACFTVLIWLAVRKNTVPSIKNRLILNFIETGVILVVYIVLFVIIFAGLGVTLSEWAG